MSVSHPVHSPPQDRGAHRRGQVRDHLSSITHTHTYISRVQSTQYSLDGAALLGGLQDGVVGGREVVPPDDVVGYAGEWGDRAYSTHSDLIRQGGCVCSLTVIT